jgi:predicted AlkP superfamily phosphohydrolase/phosphomutase
MRMTRVSTIRGKAVIISFDCVNATLLDQWTANGRLPNLARLRSSGSVARVSCKSVSIEADWYSFYTGRQPSEHGHCSYDEIVPGTYRSRMTTEPRVVCKPFWETLSHEGARIIALNPVHAAPSPIPNGIIITDWLVHDAGHYGTVASYPPEFAAQLCLRYPADPVNPNDWGHSANANPRRLLAAKSETLRRKTELLSELLRSRDWDVCYVGFDECHEMSHLFWHLHDASHPRHGAVRSNPNPIAAMLMEMDGAVGRLVADIDEDCTILVVSIGGIAPNYHWSHLVDTILRRLDNPVDRSGGAYKALRTLWNQVPHPVQKSLFGLRHHFREKLMERDRRRRRAFALPLNERAGAVRINLAGREPNGLVAPGAEYDALCQDLTEAFKALVCAQTGAPLIRSVVKTHDVLDGPYLDLLPDLMIEWNVDHPIVTATSPRTGEIRRQYTDARTGHHINDGFLLISGAGAERRELSGPVDLADIAKAVVAHVRSPQASFGARMLI